MLWFRTFCICGVLVCGFYGAANSQSDDWRMVEAKDPMLGAQDKQLEQSSAMPIQVFTLQNPCFGSFHSGDGGGSITIDVDGNRTAEGDVILMGGAITPTPVVFEVRCEPFTLLQFFEEGEFFLRGSNGDLLRVSIVGTSITFPFVSPPNADQGFTVTAGVCLHLDPGQMLASGTYVGVFQTTWVSE